MTRNSVRQYEETLQRPFNGFKSLSASSQEPEPASSGVRGLPSNEG
jgi:hypothetical protein